ncbi:MAG TPA: hypothetical protein VGD85_19540, partial [Nocardioides sp.]
MIRSTSRSTRRSLALLASLALALPAVAQLPAATAADPGRTPVTDRATAPRADGAAPVTLWAPKAVTAYSYRHRAWTDLGLRLIAQGAPFELWSTRPSYDEPIQTVWRTATGDVPLPAGSMTSFSGLDRFLSITIEPAKGRGPTLHLNRSACLNGWSERVRPDAPARSAYPQGCWYNPFTLGSVQGIQDGWATPILAQERPLRLEPGRYRVTATIAPRYAAAFGLSPADTTRTTRLTVSEEDRGGRGRVA